MAHEGGALLRLASQRGVHLGFEAAVAGGIPVIRAIREGLAADRLVRISGILNGTCNYMLTRMERAQLAFDTVLAEAQAAGYAEADPTDDLEGYDARAKLCILARIGLQVALKPADVPCRSIRPLSDVDFVYAKRLGFTIRQVSRVERIDGRDDRRRRLDRAGAGARRLGAVARPGQRKSRRDLRHVRRRRRLFGPRRRRRSDGGRGDVRCAGDGASHLAARLVPRRRR